MAVGLAAALVKQRVRSVLIALDEAGELEPQIRAAGIDHYVLGGRRLRDPRSHIRLARLFRRIRPDVVHSHNFAAMLHTAVARRLALVPRMVHTEHAFEYLAARHGHHRWIRRVGADCDAFVVVGDRLVPFFRDQVGVPASRLRVIRNGVELTTVQRPANLADCRRELGLPEHGFIVGSAGRLAPEKDLGTLIRAVARARQRRDDIQLVLVGEGVERPMLERLVAELGLSDHVRLLGWRNDIARIVSALDLFVLSSDNEGLPLAMLEAMALGVPVACTPVGEIPAVIEDGVSGQLFAVRDDRALATIILDFAANEQRRVAIGARGRSVVELGFAHGRMVAEYLDAYGLRPERPLATALAPT
jgi:glycosyltransferase involved in cell wall biosynthesis